MRNVPHMGDVEFDTPNYRLRPLSEADISATWGGWLARPDIVALLNADTRQLSKDELADYLSRFDYRDRILLGIFHKPSATHIGLFTSTTSDSGKEVLWNALIAETAFRSIAGPMEIKQLRVAIGNYFFFERGFEAAYASVVGHNKMMIAYLKSAGWELVRRYNKPSRTSPGGNPVGLLLFRLTAKRFLEREGSWPRAMLKAEPAATVRAK